jgi:uncharacterized protein YbcV (DUF1398 family)
MHAKAKSVAEACSRAAEDGSMDFPQILGKLSEAGIEGYFVDYRRAVKIYYLPEGKSIEVADGYLHGTVAAMFDAAKVAAAVGQSQRGEHSYREFCEKVIAAGCAGYIVSILGRRVVYFGRTAEMHVEHFPS